MIRKNSTIRIIFNLRTLISVVSITTGTGTGGSIELEIIVQEDAI